MRRLTAAVLILWAAGACGTEPLPTSSPAACGQAAQVLQIAQGAMDPTLRPDDLVAVVPLELSGPKRGDIVVIDWGAWTRDAGPDIAMRVIGAVGDRVELRGGKVVLNGSALAEPYLQSGISTEPLTDQPSDWVVPDGSVFVLGDGRQNAADSRFYGMVPDGSLRGRVVARCGPAGRGGPVS